MSKGLEKDTKEDTEVIKIRLCTPTGHGEHKPYIYLIQTKNKYYMVYDPGYELGNIHIYESKESIPISELKKKYPQYVDDRDRLLNQFIKERFRTDSYFKYEIALFCEELEISRELYEELRMRRHNYFKCKRYGGELP